MPSNPSLDRIHVFGASGSGTTTLASALAQELEIPLIDADELCWLSTNPSYQIRRPLEDRVSLINEEIRKSDHWVLSGSLWTLETINSLPFTIVVFLELETETRIGRLQKRESKRYSESELAPGGSRYEASIEFLQWAKEYESGGMEMRSRALHEHWLANLHFPHLRLNAAHSVSHLVQRVIHECT